MTYFAIRLAANLIMDRDAEHARLLNSREHFGRPSFAAWQDKDGKIQVRSGPNPDHATRCQNAMRSWNKIERRIKWNNWIYAGWIIVLALVLERI